MTSKRRAKLKLKEAKLVLHERVTVIGGIISYMFLCSGSGVMYIIRLP